MNITVSTSFKPNKKCVNCEIIGGDISDLGGSRSKLCEESTCNAVGKDFVQINISKFFR